MNKRRRLIAMGSATLLVPSQVFAQQPTAKVWRIGYLSANTAASGNDNVRLLKTALRDLGYIEGKNIIFELRWADGNYAKLPELARELVGSMVDLIIAVPSPAIRAAQQATTTIPIVFPTTGDPVGSGFAASLARPGGNITGFSNSNLDVSAKLLELLKEISPKLSHVALLSNPGSTTQSAMQKAFQSAAQKASVRTLLVEASTIEQIDSGIVQVARSGAKAIVFAGDAFLNSQQLRIAALALNHQLLSATQASGYARAGGLLSYGQSDAIKGYSRTAMYVDKILKGAKPGDLPIEQPTTFELIVNLKTAKALGVKIPDTILLQATKVIE